MHTPLGDIPGPTPTTTTSGAILTITGGRTTTLTMVGHGVGASMIPTIVGLGDGRLATHITITTTAGTTHGTTTITATATMAAVTAPDAPMALNSPTVHLPVAVASRVPVHSAQALPVYLVPAIWAPDAVAPTLRPQAPLAQASVTILPATAITTLQPVAATIAVATPVATPAVLPTINLLANRQATTPEVSIAVARAVAPPVALTEVHAAVAVVDAVVDNYHPIPYR